MTLWTLCLSFALASFAYAVEYAAPVLLTSGGQSADPQMVKTLLTREDIAFDFKPLATTSDLSGRGAVIIVLGGSSKGLGAAKVSAEQETARITDLLITAKKQGVPVLAMHIGGKNRRGALSDEFNKLGASHADEIIVVAGGDEDGFFKKISEENKAKLHEAAKIADLVAMLRDRFVAPAEPVQE